MFYISTSNTLTSCGCIRISPALQTLPSSYKNPRKVKTMLSEEEGMEVRMDLPFRPYYYKYLRKVKTVLSEEEGMEV